MMIVFVASNPSSKNTCPSVPFKGTRSGEIFQEWIDYIFGTDYKAVNYKIVNVADIVTPNNRRLRVSEYDLEGLEVKVGVATQIVALGRTAENALKKIGKDSIYLPHPSPLNRKLNDRSSLQEMLDRVKLALRGVGK